MRQARGFRKDAVREPDADGKEPGPVRVHHSRVGPQHQFRRLVERLVGLPLRPTTARQVLGALAESHRDGTLDAETTGLPALVDIDPGWVLARVREGARVDPLAVLAGSR